MSVSGPELVAQRLERSILDGRFKPDEALPSERVLAERWRMSRSMVREGISMLIAKGLLVRRHGKGTFLAETQDQLPESIWTEMLRRHTDIQGDLLEFRRMLEARSAELAAERHDDADRVRLQEAQAAVHAAFATGNTRERMQADLAFHHAIADATHNPVFSHLMKSMHQMLYDHMKLTLVGYSSNLEVVSAVQRQHRDLVDAILARHAQAAAAAAATHIDFVTVRMNHIAPRKNRRASSPRS